MSNGWFERIFWALYRRPLAVIIGLVTVALLSLLGLKTIPYEGGLVAMLPEGSRGRRTVEFLRDAQFADKVAVSITAEDPDSGVADLIAVMDELRGQLVDSSLIRRVQTLPGGKNMMKELVFFLDHAPELLSENDLEGLENRLSQEKIQKRIRECYVKLARPEGSFMQEILRRDPLGISTVILQRLQKIPEASGYHVMVQNGHLIHPDKRHGLLVMDAAISITDGVGSRHLVEMLRETTSDLPDGYTADIVCGHLHTVSNEDRLRADIRLTATVAGVGFFALFLLIFRDIRAALIFFIPAISILVAVNGASFFIPELSYLVLGFAPVMAGIAVDYGIHTFIAVRDGKNPYAAVRRIIRPLIIGALTTECVFLAFSVSSIPGYRQLGGLALASMALSLFGAILLLPPLVKYPDYYLKIDPQDAPEGKKGWAIFFLISLGIAGLLTTNLQIDPGVTKLDGISDDILQTEKEFKQLWGGGKGGQAIAVIGGKTYEETARRCDKFHKHINSALPKLNFISRSSVWPARANRTKNARRWEDFWTADRIEKVRSNVSVAAEKYGFAENAFTPFFDLITEEYTVSSQTKKSIILEQLERRFVKKRKGGYWFLGFFPDNPGTVEAVAKEAEKSPYSFVVSPRSLTGTLADSISSEALRISLIAGSLILFFTFFLMRNIRLSLAALLPAATGVIWLLAVMSICNLPVNVANLIAGIVVIGLCIDYGIFMAHGWAQGARVLVPTLQAVTLSAITTLIGAGVLVFAKHPALFSIGITLVLGIFTGYGTAALGVPGMCSLLGIDSAKGDSE
ncbi:MAG: hypothetical protein ACLFWL_07665 [Candidatus Brocadiia bacterium]